MFFLNCMVRVISGTVFSSVWTCIMVRTAMAYLLLQVSVPAPGNVPSTAYFANVDVALGITDVVKAM